MASGLGSEIPRAAEAHLPFPGQTSGGLSTSQPPEPPTHHHMLKGTALRSLPMPGLPHTDPP